MSMPSKHLRLARLLVCALCLAVAGLGCDESTTPPATAEPEPDASPEPEPNPEPDPEPEGEPEPNPEPEPDPEPEPTPVDPARAVEPEVLIESPVPVVAPLVDGRIVAQGDGEIVVLAPEGITSLGAESGALLSAQAVQGELIVATTDGLFAWTRGALMPSPLGELVDGVTGLHMTADGALWILDNGGLHVYRDGLLSGVDPGPMGALPMTAVGAWDGVPALWVVGDEALYAVGFGDDGLEAWSLAPEADVHGVAVNDMGGLWISAGGRVSHIADDGSYTDLILPFEARALAAHPAAPDLWIVGDGGLWQLRDGRIRPIEGLAGFQGLRAEMDGSVLIHGAAGLMRVRPGRFVNLDGLDEGMIVDRQTTVTISATNPEDVSQLSYRLDDDNGRVLEGPPWQLVLEPGPVPEGAHTLQVTAAYADGEQVVAEIAFIVQGPPTWEDDVEAIFFQHCDACHGERGYAHRMETMDVWIDEFDDIVDAIVNNRMPLPPNPMVTPEELELIRAWGETGMLRSWP